MSHLLDTDTCIYWLNGVEDVAHHVRRVGQANLFISMITVAELKYGAYNSARVEHNLKRIDDFLPGVQVLQVSEGIADKFGSLKAELRRKGQPLADFDLLIASTALVYGLIVVTNNLAHFSRIPNLKVESWRTLKD